MPNSDARRDQHPDEPYLEFARLMLDYKWDDLEMAGMGRRIGLTKRHFRQLVALMREAIVEAGWVPEE